LRLQDAECRKLARPPLENPGAGYGACHMQILCIHGTSSKESGESPLNKQGTTQSYLLTD
jgi:hypothetical protein